MRICPVGAELFHEDGGTHMTKLIIAFSILRTRLKWQKETSKKNQVQAQRLMDTTKGHYCLGSFMFTGTAQLNIPDRLCIKSCNDCDNGDRVCLSNSGGFHHPNMTVSPRNSYWILSPLNFKMCNNIQFMLLSLGEMCLFRRPRVWGKDNNEMDSAETVWELRWNETADPFLFGVHFPWKKLF